MTINTIPRWGQWASGVSLLVVALTAGALSLAVNVVAGLSVALPVAVMFGLSDVGKVLVPVVCQAIGWNRHLRTTYWLAATVSVICALIATADMFGLRLAAIDHTAKGVSLSGQQITELRTSLASVRKMASDEAQRGGCGPKCKALNDRADKLETSLSAAVASSREQTKPTVTGIGFLGQAVAKVKPETTNTASSVLLVLAGILMMELFCHLAGPAASMIGIAMYRKAEPTAPTVRKSRKVQAFKPRRTEAEVKKLKRLAETPQQPTDAKTTWSPPRIKKTGGFDRRFKTTTVSRKPQLADA